MRNEQVNGQISRILSYAPKGKIDFTCVIYWLWVNKGFFHFKITVERKNDFLNKLTFSMKMIISKNALQVVYADIFKRNDYSSPVLNKQIFLQVVHIAFSFQTYKKTKK